MWNEILNLAIKNGLWAVLFLGLFVFVIKDSSNREKKYQQTIKDLTSHLGIVNDIKEDVDEIKNIVFLSKKYAKNTKKSSKINKKMLKIKNFQKQSTENPDIIQTKIDNKNG